jgi:hypothetical protein
MRPFQPTPQQLEAIEAGAEKLWIPTKHEVISITTETITFLTLAKEEQTWDVFEYMATFSPLQSGEQYFVHRINTTYNPGTKQMARTLGNRIEFTATAVEVKQVQDIDIDEGFALGIPCPCETEVSSWHNSQYPEHPYSSNPHGFLVTIEAI